MAEKKEIKDMSDTELRHELGEYCVKQTKNGSCKLCVLSGTHHFGDGNSCHNGFFEIEDRYTLALMVSLARGYLTWNCTSLDPKDPALEDLIKSGSNVPEQPTVPPMPEPVEPVKTVECVESIEAKVSELSVNMPEDMTVIMISGKKPTSVTVFYDQEGGGTDGA